MSFAVDFRPRKNGLPYDPVTYGGAVQQLRAYTTTARTGVPVATVNGAAKISSGLYRFTVPALPDGRYYLAIVWTEAAGDLPYEDRNDSVTLPIVDPDLRRLRRLVDEPNPDGDYSDGDLAALLDLYALTSGRPDLNAAAAHVWDEKAALASASTTTGRISSVSTGDQSISYAAGSTPGEHAAKQARYFRARASIRSVRVFSSRAPYLRERRREQVDAGGLDDYGRLAT